MQDSLAKEIMTKVREHGKTNNPKGEVHCSHRGRCGWVDVWDLGTKLLAIAEMAKAKCMDPFMHLHLLTHSWGDKADDVRMDMSLVHITGSS